MSARGGVLAELARDVAELALCIGAQRQIVGGVGRVDRALRGVVGLVREPHLNARERHAEPRAGLARAIVDPSREGSRAPVLARRRVERAVRGLQLATQERRAEERRTVARARREPDGAPREVRRTPWLSATRRIARPPHEDLHALARARASREPRELRQRIGSHLAEPARARQIVTPELERQAGRSELAGTLDQAQRQIRATIPLGRARRGEERVARRVEIARGAPQMRRACERARVGATPQARTRRPSARLAHRLAGRQPGRISA